MMEKLDLNILMKMIVFYLCLETKLNCNVGPRNNRLRMAFYCVLTLSPDVPYLFLPKIGQKRQNRRFLGISTSKSGDTVKSGNFGHFCNVARWFKFKITKNWSKTPKSAIFGVNSHPNLVTLLNLNIKKDFLRQNDLQL